MCAARNVRLTESIMQILLPEHGDESLDETQRQLLLADLGSLCSEQGEFAWAARVYGEAGNQLEVRVQDVVLFLLQFAAPLHLFFYYCL